MEELMILKGMVRARDRVYCAVQQFVSYIDMRNGCGGGHSLHCCVNYPAVKRARISVSTVRNKT